MLRVAERRLLFIIYGYKEEKNMVIKWEREYYTQ
jgi:hypothetical protein